VTQSTGNIRTERRWTDDDGYFQLLRRPPLSQYVRYRCTAKQLYDNRYIWRGIVPHSLTRARPPPHIKRTQISHASIVLIEWTTPAAVDANTPHTVLSAVT